MSALLPGCDHVRDRSQHFGSVIMILTTISLRSTSVGAALALTLFALPLSLAEPDMSDMNRENPAIRVTKF